MSADISVKELMEKINESEKTRTSEDRLRLLQEARILDSKGDFVRELFSEETHQKTLSSPKTKDWMYSSKPSIVYGFHAIDESAGLKILNLEDEFEPSSNKYDWLGSGIYFWENNLERARQYAQQDSKRPDSRIKKPFVLGTILELGNCLDLLDQKYNDFLKDAYSRLEGALFEQGKPLPSNHNMGEDDFDFKARELDCSVIRYACALSKEEHDKPFDSVRAAFIEGSPIYEGARFFSENHIQIAVINPNCIKGVFLPREKVDIN